MNLFELNEAYRTVMEAEDLDPQVFKDTLDGINDAREVKWDNLASMIERLKQESTVLKLKSKTFGEESKYRDNKAKWLKHYLLNSLDDARIKKIDTENHILSARGQKAVVVIDSEDKLPKEFISTKKTVESKPDKNKIYQVLKDGGVVSGAHLQPNRGVTIK